MKIFLTFAILFSIQTINAQQLKWEYAEFVIYDNGMNSKCVASIDKGENVVKMLKGKEMVRDESDRQIEFKTPVDALNYMGSQGWEVIGFNEKKSVSNATAYLLKRRVE